MSLSVLTDEQICFLLENLTLEELESFREELKSALHEYSNGTQSIDVDCIHQPERTSIHSHATGATTLFMPSASPAGHGVKGMLCVLAPYNFCRKGSQCPSHHIILCREPSTKGRPVRDQAHRRHHTILSRW